MTLLKMTDLDLNDKRVLIREDFNVPLENGKVSNDARLLAALPTIQLAQQAGARVMLLSHLGRPKEGEYQPALSLAPVAERLSELLKQPVRFVPDWLEGVTVAPGEIVLCENVRFNRGEKNNDEQLAIRMAALCDVFVMDAFATAHRAEASTYGVAQFAPVACAGPLLMAELEALSRVLAHPARPLIAIVGGSKVSTKLTILDSLLQKVDGLILGGGIANTFLAAQGHVIGKSLCEANLIDEAKHLMDNARKYDVKLYLPIDVVVATEFSAHATPRITALKDIHADEMILDAGPQTAASYATALQQAGTILWNGPVGVFEFPAFAEGTRALALAIAGSAAFSVAGGGDTLSAIDQFGVADEISYISTGGGAFLEFVEGKTLPAVAMLQQRAKL